jgi:hypothetical protein
MFTEASENRVFPPIANDSLLIFSMINDKIIKVEEEIYELQLDV